MTDMNFYTIAAIFIESFVYNACQSKVVNQKFMLQKLGKHRKILLPVVGLVRQL